MARYISTRTIMDLYMEEEKSPGERVEKRLCEHVGLSIVGAMEDAEAGGMGEAGGSFRGRYIHTNKIGTT